MAVTEWLATASVLVANVAVPALKVPLPNTVAPSWNVTVPVGDPPDPLTVAVKVTAVP